MRVYTYIQVYTWYGYYFLNLPTLVDDASYPLAHYPKLKYAGRCWIFAVSNLVKPKASLGIVN